MTVKGKKLAHAAWKCQWPIGDHRAQTRLLTGGSLGTVVLERYPSLSHRRRHTQFMRRGAWGTCRWYEIGSLRIRRPCSVWFGTGYAREIDGLPNDPQDNAHLDVDIC